MIVRSTYPLLAVNCRVYSHGAVPRFRACGSQCGCFWLTERGFSSKIRDAKDFNRYVSRPDDPPKRKSNASRSLPNKIDARVNKSDRPTRPPVPKVLVRKDLNEQLNIRLKDRSQTMGPVTFDVKATVEKTLLRQRGSIRTSLVKVSCDEAPSNREVDSEVENPKPVSGSLNKGSRSDGTGESAGMNPAAREEVNRETNVSAGETIEEPSIRPAKAEDRPDELIISRIKDRTSPEAGRPPALECDDASRAEEASTKSQPTETSEKLPPLDCALGRPAAPRKSRRCDIIVDMPAFKIVERKFVHSRRHRIYTSGLTDTGAQGLHKPSKGYRYRVHVPRPMRQSFAEENQVVSAAAGFGFTLFYIKNSETVKLYGCGLNSEFQLGANVQQLVTYPVPVDIRLNSPKTKLLSLSCGRAHSAVATDAEGVFLFGCNKYGQCGRLSDGEDADVSDDTCTITQMRNIEGENVTSAICGQDHTLFLTESGRVFSCGCGNEGQTGLGHALPTDAPELVEGGIKDERIVRAAGKCDTVLALNDKGELFGWGSNEFRQLSNDPDLAQVPSPVRLEGVNKKCGRIVDIAAGSSFCLVLNEEGDVFVWGQGILGGGPDLCKTPVPVMLPRTLFGCTEYTPKVRSSKVFCGVDHMMVINNLKHVYAWGRNKHGCLGIGFLRDQYFPYKLAISADAVHVSCAVDHSIIVANNDL